MVYFCKNMSGINKLFLIKCQAEESLNILNTINRARFTGVDVPDGFEPQRLERGTHSLVLAADILVLRTHLYGHVLRLEPRDTYTVRILC